MSEQNLAQPLDLSAFDDLSDAPSASHALVPQAQSAAVAAQDANTALAPQPPLPRLVEISTLGAEDVAAARQSADKVDFRNTASLLSHGDNVLAEIAQSSRQLLTGVRLGDAGE